MIAGLALGAALYYDFELAAAPRPFEVIVEALFGTASPDGSLRQWFTHREDRKAPPPAPLDLHKLVRLIERGGLAMAAAETPPNTTDADLMLGRVATTPVANHPERFSQTRCRYDAVAVFGAARLRELRPQRILDAIV